MKFLNHISLTLRILCSLRQNLYFDLSNSPYNYQQKTLYLLFDKH